MTIDQELSAAKRALLARRLKGAAARPDAPIGVSNAANAEAGVPLSFSQQRLWLVDQLEPGQCGYNISKTIRLSGAFDIPAFRRSLDEVVRRHDVLRTVFEVRDGAPVQRVLPWQPVDMPIEDLQALSGTDLDERIAALADEQAYTPFDLRLGPLLRARLLKLAPREHLVLFTIHHIAYDARSQGVLVTELGTLYEAFLHGRTSPLPPLPLQYGEFAQWQRRWLQGDLLDRQLRYWTERLSGAPALLDLPTDRPRPARQRHRGAEFRFRLDVALSQRLKELAREQQATLFMVLLAAFSVLMARLSGQSDICVGTPIANRTRASFESLIGFFTNTLVMRTQVDSQQTFIELLQQVRRHALDAYEAQDVPFERLVDSLKPPRQSSHSPIFQVMLILQNADMGEFHLPGLDLHLETSARTASKYDLSLDVLEVKDELLNILEYDTDLFDATTIERVADHFRKLLEAIVADSGRPVGKLDMLGPIRRETLLHGWNDTSTRFEQGHLLVHQLFEEQARRTPKATALVFEDRILSYQDLDRRANLLAHRLIERGVRPDTLVGLCLERSIEMVVALLGVLKAGAAYVPLDPTYPETRLSFMMRDSAPAVVLVHAPTRERVQRMADDDGRQVWEMDESRPLDPDCLGDADRAPVPEQLGLTPRHLAYVIYTSGSTGRPKGAMNQHDGVVNRLLWARRQFAVGQDDRVLQKTPFGFDVSVWEFFLPLMSGARLVIARPGGHHDPRYLANVIAQEGVTIVHFVPSMLQVFLAQGLASAGAGVRHVLCSGEALPAPLAAQFHRELPSVALHNLYGPTEAAVDVTCWRCSPSDTAWTVPIGRPIANTRIHILDPLGQPVPAGVVGELHIAGLQVGRGYLGRPDLTEERFVADPFCGDPDARLYRTGDLARYRADGVIEYCGRNDFQIKLRGLRIELGEIESAIASQAEVDEAAVVAQPGPAGDTRLVAYVRLRPGAALDPAALRHALQGQLPDYMVPTWFVALERFPLTPNGKLDRAALPAPDLATGTSASAFEAPRTATESTLARIWARVLRLPRVGLSDNFFELGGHSLMILELQDAIAKEAGWDLPVVDLFQYPSVAKQAAYIDARPPSPSQPPSAH